MAMFTSHSETDEIEDYFNFGCSYNINASGSPLHSVRCPWGGSDEGFPDGWAAQYVQTTMIPELKDLVERYQPHYLYADGDWSGSDDFLQVSVLSEVEPAPFC